MFSQATLEHSETETRQRLTVQVEKQEREISQLQKKLEHEVEQRHALLRNHDVSALSMSSLSASVASRLKCLVGLLKGKRLLTSSCTVSVSVSNESISS